MPIRTATREETAGRLALPDAVELIRPGFDPDDYLALTDGKNLLLATQWADDIYEIHWLFTDRGRLALNAGIDMLRHLFQEYQARVVVGQTPAHKRAARWFSRQVGCRSNGMTATELGDMELFSITRQQFEAQHEFPDRKSVQE